MNLNAIARAAFFVILSRKGKKCNIFFSCLQLSIFFSSLKCHREASWCLGSCGLVAQQVCLLIVSIYLNWFLIKASRKGHFLPRDEALGTWVGAPENRWVLSASQFQPWYILFLHDCKSPLWYSARDLLFCKQLLGRNLVVVFTSTVSRISASLWQMLLCFKWPIRAN